MASLEHQDSGVQVHESLLGGERRDGDLDLGELLDAQCSVSISRSGGCLSYLFLTFWAEQVVEEEAAPQLLRIGHAGDVAM